MPAHIYSMVGLWQDSITSNLSALEIQPDYYHAADFTVYAHLQLAQDDTAAKMIAKALATPERGDRPPSMANFTAKAAMPARYVLERADWKAAAALPLTPTEYPQADSLTHFTRGLGLARLGNRAARLARSTRWNGSARRWRNRATGIGRIVRRSRSWRFPPGWRSAGARRDQAATLMRQAADSEDASIKHVAMENRLYPMRELLGELLLEAGQSKDALAEFTKRAEAAAEPLSGTLWRGTGRRGRRRCGERQGVLRQGHRAVETRRRAAPRTAARPGFRRFEVVHSPTYPSAMALTAPAFPGPGNRHYPESRRAP